jgi:hypothetical protein
VSCPTEPKANVAGSPSEWLGPEIPAAENQCDENNAGKWAGWVCQHARSSRTWHVLHDFRELRRVEELAEFISL